MGLRASSDHARTLRRFNRMRQVGRPRAASALMTRAAAQDAQQLDGKIADLARTARVRPGYAVRWELTETRIPPPDVPGPDDVVLLSVVETSVGAS